MPYITQDLREAIDPSLKELLALVRGGVPAGVLNYMVTSLVRSYLADDPNYEAFNAVIGALECAKLELYRRMLAPYEDQARVRNGDVGPSQRTNPRQKKLFEK